MRKIIVVDDLMQQGYTYELTEPEGENFHPGFRPDLTPPQMLELGVFGGKYMTDCRGEFPASWFEKAQLFHERHDPALETTGRWTSAPLESMEAFSNMLRGSGIPLRSIPHGASTSSKFATQLLWSSTP